MNQPTPEEIEAAKEKAKLEQELQTKDETPQSVAPETTFEAPAPTVINTGQYGIFATAASGDEKSYTLSNDLLTLSLTNKGGRINYAELKEHYKVLSQPKEKEVKELVKLFEDEKNKWGYELQLTDRIINTGDLFFEARPSGNSISFRATTESGGYIEQLYTCLLYTSPSPRDKRQSRMPSSA